MYAQEISRLKSEISELQNLRHRISSASGRCERLIARLEPIAERAHLATAGSISEQHHQMVGAATEAHRQLRSTRERVSDSAHAVLSQLHRLEAEISRLRSLQQEAERHEASRR
ncbi:hypothetical protein [Auritidibacter ignavus]|uniref:hypothetical protein n=1 Tax=Auritidibacter ignavus TaxID=678932 RepID=UPI0024B8AA23|nr:hypothetical protein [Auritidibacter ignavus]WHS34769.1 hypothetical protein QM403_10750 [Auritidibacter ignavus]